MIFINKDKVITECYKALMAEITSIHNVNPGTYETMFKFLNGDTSEFEGGRIDVMRAQIRGIINKTWSHVYLQYPKWAIYGIGSKLVECGELSPLEAKDRYAIFKVLLSIHIRSLSWTLRLGISG